MKKLIVIMTIVADVAAFAEYEETIRAILAKRTCRTNMKGDYE